MALIRHGLLSAQRLLTMAQRMQASNAAARTYIDCSEHLKKRPMRLRWVHGDSVGFSGDDPITTRLQSLRILPWQNCTKWHPRRVLPAA